MFFSPLLYSSWVLSQFTINICIFVTWPLLWRQAKRGALTLKSTRQPSILARLASQKAEIKASEVTQGSLHNRFINTEETPHFLQGQARPGQAFNSAHVVYLPTSTHVHYFY